MHRIAFIRHLCSQHGVISLLPILVLTLLIGGIFLAVNQAKKKQDVITKAQMAMDPATSGDCFILPSTSNPNTLDSTRIDTAVQMAFCDTFDAPKYDLGDISVFEPNRQIPRSGALDDRRWSFARAAQNENPGSGNFDPMQATTAQFCLQTKTGVLPNKDSFFCGHQFNESEHWMEAFDDQTGYQWNSAMIRQPFDFTNRTGRIVFDVDALTIGGHSFWTELWVTDEPIPAPHLQVPGSEPSPKNAFALRLEGYVGLCPTDGAHMTVGDMAIIRDYKFGTEGDLVPFNRDSNNCITTQDDHFNHFEVRLSKNRMEVWASDKSDDHGMTYPNFRRLAWADNLNLPFTRGYVHFEHVMYNNEDKGTGTPYRTFHWDNIGFDGPSQPTARGYYFPDGWQALGVKNRTDSLNMGYGFTDDGSQLVACTFTSGNCNKIVVPPLTVNNVNLTGATSALLTLSAVGSATSQIQYRLNGTTWHTFVSPFPDQWGLSSQRGTAIPVQLSELRQDTNTLELKAYKDTAVANIELHVFPGDVLPARVSPRGGNTSPTPMPTPSPVSAKLNITQPTTNQSITGTSVTALYTPNKNTAPAGVAHVHWSLDGGADVLDTNFTGSFTFSNIPVGSHILMGHLVDANHQMIAGSEASVSFTTRLAATPSPSPSPSRTPSPSPSPTATPCVKIGDFDNDCDVDIVDLSFLLGYYRAGDLRADLNHDNRISIADVSVFASAYGK